MSEMMKAAMMAEDYIRSSRMIDGSPFKPGDVVQMKRIGGPWMTVEHVRPGHGGHFLIGAVWFDKRRRVQRDTFDSFALEVVKERAPIDAGKVTMVERK